MKTKRFALFSVIAVVLTFGVLLAPGSSRAQLPDPAPGASKTPVGGATPSLPNAGPDAGIGAVEPREADAAADRGFSISAPPQEIEALGALQEPILDRGLEIQESLAKDPGFAGVWLEGAELHVATTSAVDVPAKLLEGVVPAGHAVRVHAAAYSYSELRALQARIDSDRLSWAARGVTILGTGVDVKLNRMAVSVLDPEGTFDPQPLIDAYGTRVLVRSEKEMFRGLAGIVRPSCAAIVDE